MQVFIRQQNYATYLILENILSNHVNLNFITYILNLKSFNVLFTRFLMLPLVLDRGQTFLMDFLIHQLKICSKNLYIFFTLNGCLLSLTYTGSLN